MCVLRIKPRSSGGMSGVTSVLSPGDPACECVPQGACGARRTTLWICFLQLVPEIELNGLMWPGLSTMRHLVKHLVDTSTILDPASSEEQASPAWGRDVCVQVAHLAALFSPGPSLLTSHPDKPWQPKPLCFNQGFSFFGLVFQFTLERPSLPKNWIFPN